MLRYGLIVLLLAVCEGFYVRDQRETYTPYTPHAQELRSTKNSIELFGQRVEVPEWLNSAADKTRGMFDSATDLFGKGRATSRKSPSDGLMTNLKKDENTRIWFAVYVNILILILIYVFITIKLALLSLSEGNMERKKRNAFSTHVAFDSPDYNLPLASIATRDYAPMTADNPMKDFEMAREVFEEDEVLNNVSRLDYDAIRSSEREESF